MSVQRVLRHTAFANESALVVPFKAIRLCTSFAIEACAQVGGPGGNCFWFEDANPKTAYDTFNAVKHLQPCAKTCPLSAPLKVFGSNSSLAKPVIGKRPAAACFKDQANSLLTKRYTSFCTSTPKTHTHTCAHTRASLGLSTCDCIHLCTQW